MKKILVIRFSSIGDIVLTTPVIRAIDEQTDYDIHVLTKHSNKGLFESNPRVKKVHSFKKTHLEVIPELLEEKFEIIIDLHKNLRSSKIKRKLKIPSHTFPKLNIDKWLLVNFKINRLPKVHIVDRYFEAVSAFGVVNDGLGLEYYIPASDEVAPENIDYRLKEGYIGIVIGGQHSTKILPVQKVAQIITKLKMPVVLLGGPEDRKQGEEIISLSSDSDVINTCGELNINQSASLVSLADAIITNDTGLMHISSAFNKPTISIWGNTVPDFGMYPYMPTKPNNYIISEVVGLRCRPCGKLGFKKCPKKHFRCMLDQDPDTIIKSLNSIL